MKEGIKHPITHKDSIHGLRTLWVWIAAFVAVILVQLFAADSIDPYIYTIIMYAGVNIILAVSLNLVNGFTGQFSMGHAGFMSVGGYTASFITTTLQAHQPQIFANPVTTPLIFLGVLILGGLAASFVGYLVGLPSLRLKGDYLAIVTLGFGEIIRVVILNIDAIGGARGMPDIPALSNF